MHSAKELRPNQQRAGAKVARELNYAVEYITRLSSLEESMAFMRAKAAEDISDLERENARIAMDLNAYRTTYTVMTQTLFHAGLEVPAEAMVVMGKRS